MWQYNIHKQRKKCHCLIVLLPVATHLFTSIVLGLGQAKARGAVVNYTSE